MKNISGQIESTKPISLSKAAKVLSTFVTADTGASHAVSTYLQGPSNSFNDLVLFHKQHSSYRKRNKRQSLIQAKATTRRQGRVRKKVGGTPERPRMSVYRSNKHIYVQVIDDTSVSTVQL